MSALWINVIKVAFVAGLYLFLWRIARAIGGHLRDAPSKQKVTAGSAVPTALVVAIAGPDPTQTRHVEVRGPLVVGRGAVDIVIDDPFASDKHLRLSPNGGQLIVEDLGSTNGTMVNDTVIHGPTGLKRGDTVRVGTTTLEVR